MGGSLDSDLTREVPPVSRVTRPLRTSKWLEAVKQV